MYSVLLLYIRNKLSAPHLEVHNGHTKPRDLMGTVWGGLRKELDPIRCQVTPLLDVHLQTLESIRGTKPKHRKRGGSVVSEKISGAQKKSLRVSCGMQSRVPSWSSTGSAAGGRSIVTNGRLGRGGRSRPIDGRCRALAAPLRRRLGRRRRRPATADARTAVRRGTYRPIDRPGAVVAARPPAARYRNRLRWSGTRQKNRKKKRKPSEHRRRHAQIDPRYVRSADHGALALDYLRAFLVMETAYFYYCYFVLMVM